MAKVDPRLLLLLGLCLAAWNARVNAVQESPEPPSRPLFVRNQGTWPDAVRYLGRAAGTLVRAERGALILQRETEPGQGVMVRLTLGSTACEPEGLEVSTALFHFFLGDEPDRWRTRVPSFAALRFPEAWPGIDLVVRDGGQDLVLEAVGGTAEQLSEAEFEWEGADVVDCLSDGRAVVETYAGAISLRVAWKQKTAGAALPIAFSARGLTRLGFETRPGSPSEPSSVDQLTSDLLFSTFIGTADGIGESAVGLTHDSRGNLVVGGRTDGTAFPITPGAFSLPKSDRNITVAVISPTEGTLLYATMIGGRKNDRPEDFTLAPGDLPVVVGRTDSPDFPTTPGAFDDELESVSGEAFAFCLSQKGDALVFSSLLGQGTGLKRANTVVARMDGSIVVGGFSDNPAGIPTTPGAFSSSGELREGFVTAFAPDGRSLVWSTLLGGSSVDEVHALELLPDSSILVGGTTSSTDFPITPGAFDVTKAGMHDAFLVKMVPDGSNIAWSSFLGGMNADGALAIDSDAFGRPVVVGNTDSPNFPKTPGAFDATYAGDGDGFLTYFEADGSGVLYSTLIGGRSPEFLEDVHVDASGIVTIAGATVSPDFPSTAGAWDVENVGLQDGFATRFDAAGTLLYSSFLGEDSLDGFLGMSAGPDGRAAFAGFASSLNYPTTANAPFPAYLGRQNDQVVSVLGMLPSGVTRLGSSGLSCLGETILHAASQPASDNTTFGFRASGAPPSSAGLLLLGLGALSSPLPIGEAKLWLDPLAPLWPIAVSADPFGYASLPLPLGSGLRGVVFYAQAFFLATANCPSPGGIAATGALRLQVQ